MPTRSDGHEVRRELHALERPAEHGGRRLDGEGLREPRDALDQDVPSGEQADQYPLEHLFLAGDHPPDLEQGLFELAADLFHALLLARVGPKVYPGT